MKQTQSLSVDMPKNIGKVDKVVRFLNESIERVEYYDIDGTFEDRLRFSVLVNAARDLIGTCTWANIDQSIVEKEAKYWIETTEYEGPFTFISICEDFGIDANWLRAELLRRWRETKQ